MERKELSDLIRSQKIEPDIVINHGKLINVNSSEIYETDVAIAGDRIALVGEEACKFASAKTKIIDAQGKYIAPGLIDFHYHIGPSLLTPNNSSFALLQRGTTAIATDFYEYAATGGLRALRFALSEAKNTPLKIIFKVPMMALLQNSPYGNSGKISLNDLLEVLDWKETTGLCEIQDKMLSNASIRRILRKARAKDLALCGHVMGFESRNVGSYLALVPSSSDHETKSANEAVQKIRAGLKVAVREGSAAASLSEVIKAITQNKMRSDRFLLCTGEIDPMHLEMKGHMDHVVRKAIASGVSPIQAVQMATLNVARFYKLESELGSIATGRVADIVLVKDISDFSTDTVIANGKIVCENGQSKISFPLRSQVYPKYMKNTIRLRRKLNREDLLVNAGNLGKSKGKVKAHIIVALEGQITSGRAISELPVSGDGNVLSDAASDVLHISLVERYGHGRIGNAFVSGFNLRSGAIAQSIAPVPENIISVGPSTEDMAIAINRLAEIGGGFTIANDEKILSEVSLPILGIASEKSLSDLSKEFSDILHIVKDELGCKLNSPFLTLMGMGDAHIPELKITEYGLVENATLKIVNPIAGS
jgi:adenine deaminase